MTVFERIYPNYKICGIMEMLVEGVGDWHSTLVSNSDDVLAIAKRGTDDIGRKIHVLCLLIQGPSGDMRYADFSPNELI